jgi:hypothetical protein
MQAQATERNARSPASGEQDCGKIEIMSSLELLGTDALLAVLTVTVSLIVALRLAAQGGRTYVDNVCAKALSRIDRARDGEAGNHSNP